MSKELDYDNQDWSKFFILDTTSPSGLAWNLTSYSAYGKKLERWPGKPAGSLQCTKNGDNKAWSVSINLNNKQTSYKVHRIIACMNGINVNGFVIDHLNGISKDNRIENIRVTTQEVNSRNCKIQDNSPYGIQGVGFQEDSVGNTYFIARWHEADKRHQSSFPTKKLGIMPAFAQAVIKRNKEMARMNAEGAGYSDRHHSVNTALLEFSEYERDMKAYAAAMRNNKMRSSNSTGVVGVSWGSNTDFNQTRAIAHWVDENANQHSKSFSVLKYGLLPAFKLACEYRVKMVEELSINFKQGTL